jgi:hypothetical protein
MSLRTATAPGAPKRAATSAASASKPGAPSATLMCSVCSDEVTCAHVHQREFWTLIRRETERRVRGNKFIRTFSTFSMNTRRWCKASNGARAAKYALAANSTTLRPSTVRSVARGPKRRASASASGHEYASTPAVSVAMMWSAGASAPMRPVWCGKRVRVSGREE